MKNINYKTLQQNLVILLQTGDTRAPLEKYRKIKDKTLLIEDLFQIKIPGRILLTLKIMQNPVLDIDVIYDNFEALLNDKK